MVSVSDVEPQLLDGAGGEGGRTDIPTVFLVSAAKGGAGRRC